MNNYDWQVFLEYRPGMMSTFIYVSRRREHGVMEFLTKGGEEYVTVKDGAYKDDVYFARYEDDLIGSLIVEALDKRGVKAPSQSFIAGKLEATENHLQDMRALNKNLPHPKTTLTRRME